MLLVVFFCPFAYGKIIYVDDDAVGANDGSSWTNAYNYLQDAITIATAGDEILVAQGIYKPDQGIGVTLGDWGASFHLKNGVTIKGGYVGFSAPDPNVRDVGEYETILSGDLNGNDVYVNDPDYLLNERTRAENSWTVVEGSNTDSTAVLDGFTITGGDFTVITFGLGGDPVGGAGMFISSGSPTLINCTFTDNVTNNIGGGLLIYDDSNPTLLNCKFTRNYAESGGGGIFSSESGPTLINCTFCNNYARRKGGAMFTFRSNPELTDCTFSGNSIPDIPTGLNEGGGALRNSDSNLVLNNCAFSDNTASYGAGMYNENNSSLLLKNCTFRNNLAGISGGGMLTEDSNDLRLIDCIFSGNSAKHSGGGMANKYSNVVLVNCIFSGNKAYGEPWPYTGKGGGLYAFGNIKLINCTNCTFTCNWAQQGHAIAKSGTSDFRLTNCILWDGGNEIFDIIPNRITFDTSYSNIQNVLEGKCNINENPLFANPGYWADTDDPNIVVEPNNSNAVWIDGDYHLKSQAGRWDPVSQSWVQDDVTSPCIDVGDPNSPVGFEPLPNGGIINMGAYGGTTQASLSLSTAVANGVIIDQQLNAAGQGYTVVRLYGSYYEMGYAHGDLLADYIVRSVDETKELFGGLYTGMRTAMADSVWKPAEIEQELDGMVDALAERHPAAGIDKLDLKMFNGLGDLLYACRSHTCWGRYVAAPIKTLSTRRLDFPTPIGSLNHHVLIVYVPDDGSARWINLGFPGMVTAAQGINEFGTLVSLHDYNSWGADISSGRMPRMIACRYALTYLPSSDLSNQLSDVFVELQNYEIMTGTFLNYYAPEGYGGVMTCNPNRTGPDFYNLRTPQYVWHHGEAMITTNQWTNGNYTPSDEDFGADVYYNDETPKTHESHWSLVDPVNSQDGLQRLSVAYRVKGDMTIWADGRIDGIGRTPRLEYEWSELFGPYEQGEAAGLAELAALRLRSG